MAAYKISDNLFLVQTAVQKSVPPVRVAVPTHHIVVLDCSGSMYSELPKIREQLKKRLPKLLQEKDIISIVWFSGKGEFGTLLEAESVATLADLKDVNTAIDRWVKPIGLTGFKEPLEEVWKLTNKVNKGYAASLCFMSDGHDNCSQRADILKAVEKAAGGLSSATFVEYGYYADRPLLTAMAEKSGGSLIFAEDFDKYAPTFEAVMQRKVSGAPRIEVKIPGDTVGGFAWSMSEGELITYAVEGGSIHVPEDSNVVWYLSPTVVGDKSGPNGPVNLAIVAELKSKNNQEEHPGLAAAYAAVSLFSVRMQPNVVYPLLKALGDVKYIEAFGGCFGKQKYSEFMDASKTAAFDSKVRFEQGYDPNKVPKDDAFTVLDLLRLLSSDDENKLLLDHPEFKYSRIGRGRVDASEVLTAEDQAEIQKITAEIAKTKDPKKVTELTSKIAAITASKGPGLKFSAKDVKDTGYSISNLTFNEERPNCSVLVRKEGTVDLSGRLSKEATLEKIPGSFETFIFRNYAIIRDGLVNVEKLPCKVSSETMNKLKAEGVIDRMEVIGDGLNDVIIDLKKLPVINRKMVQAVSAKVLFEKEYDLCKARAAQKVYNTYKKERFPKKSEGFEILYGKDAAIWLKEQGFTDYSGFSPKSVQAESTDFYMGKELHVSLKGLSSLPSVKEVKEKMAKGKVNPAGALMVPYVEEVEGFLSSDIYNKASDKDKVFEAWLDGQQKAATKKVRSLLFDLAQIKFSIVVGQTWPSEFKSIDENSLKITVDGNEIEGKVEAKEVQIKI